MQNRLNALLLVVLSAVIACGIALRFVNLGAKDFWHDECETALVLSGQTERELTDYLSHGPVTFATVQSFQRIGPQSSLVNMYKVLREDEPGHAPGFYVLAYFFCAIFGSWPITLRMLTALLSVAQLPIIYWLSKEIYEQKNTALFTTALAAMSPFLIYYAQEARDYSLGLLFMFLSSALLLYALRTKNARAWIGYAATTTIGLYSWLFMVIVAVSQAVFMLFQKWQWKERWLPFLLASFASALLFVPWLVQMNGNRENIARIHDWLKVPIDVELLIQSWTAIPSKPFAIYGDWTRDMTYTLSMLALLVVISFVAALLLSIKNRRLLLPILIVIAWVLAFAVPDFMLGGSRSAYQRHQAPILAALLLIFPALILWLGTYKRLLLRVVAVLIAAYVLGCEAQSSWHFVKSPEWPTKAIRLRYINPTAQEINSDQAPLVVCEQATTNIGEILSLSHVVRPDGRVLFLLKVNRFDFSPTTKRFYLFNPSPALEDEVALKGYSIHDAASVHQLKIADRSDNTKSGGHSQLPH